MTLVVDASMVVAALVDGDLDGRWAGEMLAAEDVAAPHVLLAEVANILRRASLAGDISSDTASLAYADLLDLRVDLFPYAPFAERIWELRANVTSYDAWYVALAENLGVPLATLDGRLKRATGPRCEFVLPPQEAEG